MTTIKISEETHYNLSKIKGRLSIQNGKDRSFQDIIDLLISEYMKGYVKKRKKIYEELKKNVESMQKGPEKDTRQGLLQDLYNEIFECQNMIIS